MRIVAVVLALLWGCGGEEGARRVDHRAFVATSGAVSSLALASTPTGESITSWKEPSGEGDLLRWTSPLDDGAAVHQVTLGPPASEWDVSALLSTGPGFARMALDTGLFADLRLAADATVESYEPAYSLADLGPPYRAVGLSTGVVVLAVSVYPPGLQLWVPAGDDWRLARLIGAVPCISLRTAEPVPFAATALLGNQVVVVALESDTTSTCAPRLHVFGPGGEGDTVFDITGSVLDPETGAPAWSVAQLVTGPSGVLGVLWLSTDGRVRVHSLREPGALDFDSPVYDAGDAPVADARLLVTESSLVLTYRRDEEGVLSPTEAVVIDPAGPSASESFRWPVDDAACRDLAGVPRGAGVEYVCVAPCVGAGCREHWLYHGRVELP